MDLKNLSLKRTETPPGTPFRPLAKCNERRERAHRDPFVTIRSQQTSTEPHKPQQRQFCCVVACVWKGRSNKGFCRDGLNGTRDFKSAASASFAIPARKESGPLKGATAFEPTTGAWQRTTSAGKRATRSEEHTS